MSENYTIKQLNEDTWAIEEGHVRFFLLAGKEKALLIDSGMMIHNAKDIAQTLTDLPVELINTHADRDHIGSNKQFEAPYMSPMELSNYNNGNEGVRGDITPVWDGDIMNLGERALQIIALPGHTPGSIAILDKKHRALFSGDPIQTNGNVFMFGVHREMHAYRHSLLRLLAMGDDFDVIYPSHGTPELSPAILPQLIEAAERIIAGEIPGEMMEMHGNQILRMDAGITAFLRPAK